MGQVAPELLASVQSTALTEAYLDPQLGTCNDINIVVAIQSDVLSWLSSLNF